MNAKRILCPVDFSPTSDFALKFASSLARENESKLYVVHVEDTYAHYETGQHTMSPMDSELDSTKLMKMLPKATNVTFEEDILRGDTAEEILRFVEENNIDLIVIGSHGRKGVSRLLMGSVAEAIVRRAHVPVLTVKPTEKDLVSHEECNTEAV